MVQSLNSVSIQSEVRLGTPNSIYSCELGSKPSLELIFGGSARKKMYKIFNHGF